MKGMLPGRRPVSLSALGSLAMLLVCLGKSATSAAEIRCAVLRYAFQPDCFQPPCPSIKRKLGDRLDLGPQIAVWVETADRSRFIDTVLVTNVTARFGLGNRPGLANLPSGPKHPYGKRLMALPVWAWARGKLYPPVVMQDGHEEWMGFHESISTPDPYYCRPMGLGEVDVDAISCPTKVFNSAKGRLAGELPSVPYPPRNDLMVFGERDCDAPGTGSRGCERSAERFKSMNDLDSVAAATPPFEKVFEGQWTVASQLRSDGDYALAVEVNREFDQNPTYRPAAYEDRMLSQNGFTQTGLPNNLGQPSVIYRVPFRIDGRTALGVASRIAGHGAADGLNGTLHGPDGTISTGPGSGEGRLRTIASPFGEGEPGKLFVKLEACSDTAVAIDDCHPLPAAPAAVTDMVVIDAQATSAVVEFRHSGVEGSPVGSYDIRLRQGRLVSQEGFEEGFIEGVPVNRVDPEKPGTMANVQLRELKPLTDYMIGVRALGRCGTQSTLVQKHFTTTDLEWKQLTGCFVATAAYGSPLAPAVATLRTLRDRARGRSALLATIVDLYERSSPPLAAVLRQNEGVRAFIRRLLAPALSAAGSVSRAPGHGTPAGTLP
jgi:hypothetical protein